MTGSTGPTDGSAGPDDRSPGPDGWATGFGGMTSRSVVAGAMAATTASGAIVVVATAVTVLGVGVALDVPTTAASAVLAGAVLAVAAWLSNREGPLATGAGSLAVSVGVLAAGYALTRPFGALGESFSVGLVLFAFASLVAGLGAGATIPGSLGDGQWARTVLRAGAACVLPGLVVLWVLVENVQETALVVDALGSLLWEAVSVVVFPVGPGVNLGGFVALASLAAVATAYALGVLPVADLVRASRRPTVSARIRTARPWLRRIALVGFPLSVLLTAAPPEMLQAALADLAIDGLLGVVVDAHWLRALLAGVAGVALGATWGTLAVRRLARLDPRRLLRVIAVTTPGGLVLLAIAATMPGLVLDRFRVGPATAIVEAGVDFLGATVLAVVVLVALVLGTTVVLSLVTTAAALGFVPDRSAAPSVAAGGVLLAAVGFGIVAGPRDGALVTFAAVAASMVVWDVGNYGVDVTAELGGTTSRPVELLHAAGSVLVGALAVLAALVALWAARTLAAGGGLDGPGLVALVVLVLATLLLMSTLDG